MSDEGVRLVMRTALVAYMIAVAVFFRVLVGPGKNRGEVMLLGTLGGLSFGVWVSHYLSGWFQTDVSAVCAVLGVTLGWAVAWLVFARYIPPEEI